MQCGCSPWKMWVFIGIVMVCFSVWFLKGTGYSYMNSRICTPESVRALFPSSPQEFTRRVDASIEQVQKDLAVLLAIPAEERTFANTVYFFDQFTARFYEISHVAWVLQNMSPDEGLREAASQARIQLQNIHVDLFSNNRDIYQAVCDYVEHAGRVEVLNEQEKKYLKEMLEDFEKGGINLPDEQQERMRTLQKELAELAQNFKLNINDDLRSITVDRAALAGLTDAFIDNVPKNDEGNYVLGVDYPTYYTVMESCAVEATRHALWKAFNNRAYPVNEPLLKTIIKIRDELAHILGFASYAHMDLDNQMVKTPERARQFLEELLQRSHQKLALEMAHLKTNLPEGVTLTLEGQFKRWDIGYVMNEYKKKHLNLDNEKIREYFPVQQTVDQILDIYGTFLNIEFRQLPLEGLWHPDVRYIMAFTKTGELLGHLLLDLHPRPHKYGHACAGRIIPPFFDKDGTRHPAVVGVLANFPHATDDQPGLLRYEEVKVFFHEFGHAMHELFGATQLIGFSGMAVKRDFVEMPSQMLEEWLYDPAILKKMSGHYKTGAPLDDETIGAIIAVKQFGMGYFVQRQSWLSLISLECFTEGADKNPEEIQKNLARSLFKEYLAEEADDHMETSFGHLMGYGACYYGYLWSKVFALDMFDYVKQRGLLNPAVGQHYIDTVISKGGSVEPDQILVDFLGRQPNMDAFWKDCGL